MKLWKNAMLFSLGGAAYLALELLWRGWTDGSMFLLGGACFLAIGQLNLMEHPLPLPWRTAVGTGIILMGELGAGLIVNRQYAVWDYRELPLNYHGQICLPFAVLWIPVSLAAIFLHQWLRRGIDRLT